MSTQPDLSSREDGSYSSSGPEHSGHKDTSSSLTTTAKPTDNTTTSESSTLAKQETIAVNRSKMAVLAVLAVAALGVGALTYWFTHKSETIEFEDKFHDFSIEIEDLVHDEARSVFNTIANFATTVTSYSLATEATWPFVSIPHMEIRGMELNTLTNSLMIGFSPLVYAKDQSAWERYATYMQGWIQEGLDYSEELHSEHRYEMEHLATIYPSIYDNLDEPTPELGDGPYLPMWQVAPAPHDPHSIMYNLLRHDVFDRVFHGMNETLQPMISEATDLEFFYGGSIRDQITHPHSVLFQPVFADFEDAHRDSEHLKGVIMAILPWDHYFENILPPEATGVVVVMKGTCGDVFSYQMNGAEAVFLGYEDFHDPAYQHLEEHSRFAPFRQRNFSGVHEHCFYDIYLYPSEDLEADYRTSKPIIYAVLVVGVFFVTAMFFVTYDYLVQVRQAKVMLAAKKSNLVVASLFPKNVRERILADVEEQLKANDGNTKGVAKNLRLGALPRSELKNFLNDKEAAHDGAVFDTKPIADLFLSTTIMFGDISGFTAWSSVREPTQVFTLLETIYHSFDEIARRRRVFKVETIGDCYVAVCGLPEPRKDHASVMARFARDCIHSMNDLTKKLEVSLGPDTGDLKMRVGLHSGPVTAGVLRGEKSRFQLFGDTVNTAARMEAHGVSNRIHCSKETAELLKMSGKNHWVIPRNDRIKAKGKGHLDTYFLEIKKQSSGSQTSAKSASSNGSVTKKTEMPQHLETLCSNKSMDAAIPEHVRRKIQWNTDVLLRMVRQIVARRNAEKNLGMSSSSKSNKSIGGSESSDTDDSNSDSKNRTVLDEVREIIYLPEFNAEAAKLEEDPSKVQLPEEVVDQMREYVTVIASLYHHDNPFHNFEHASHVTMSVVKLLSRIVAPEEVLIDSDDDVIEKRLHDYTFGITSCPLTQFAVAFSALIHDVDHQGVPNTQLIKEKFDIASIYRNQSVAEQNSVDLAWTLFMEDNFKALRRTICDSDDERKRFRQLVVNVVLATDICDAELKKLRNGRWQKAFSGETPSTEQEAIDALNRKATIVLEHLIQASDVAHTMQHWHIYRKWNECFFEENMRAYRAGRADRDPTEYWYQGELGFFDFYIIPLAKKLKDCGVFGVSSDEYLNYAQSNRREWELQGKEVVANMSAKFLPPLVEEDLEEDLEEEDEEHDEEEHCDEELAP